MSLPPQRHARWLVIAVLAVILVREWSIRRHEASVGAWPRAADEAVAA